MKIMKIIILSIILMLLVVNIPVYGEEHNAADDWPQEQEELANLINSFNEKLGVLGGDVEVDESVTINESQKKNDYLDRVLVSDERFPHIWRLRNFLAQTLSDHFITQHFVNDSQAMLSIFFSQDDRLYALHVTETFCDLNPKTLKISGTYQQDEQSPLNFVVTGYDAQQTPCLLMVKKVDQRLLVDDFLKLPDEDCKQMLGAQEHRAAKRIFLDVWEQVWQVKNLPFSANPEQRINDSTGLWIKVENAHQQSMKQLRKQALKVMTEEYLEKIKMFDNDYGIFKEIDGQLYRLAADEPTPKDLHNNLDSALYLQNEAGTRIDIYCPALMGKQLYRLKQENEVWRLSEVIFIPYYES